MITSKELYEMSEAMRRFGKATIDASRFVNDRDVEVIMAVLVHGEQVYISSSPTVDQAVEKSYEAEIALFEALASGEGLDRE